MNLHEFYESIDDLKDSSVQAKFKVIMKTLAEADLMMDDVLEILSNIEERVLLLEQDDAFGTEGLKL